LENNTGRSSRKIPGIKPFTKAKLAERFDLLARKKRTKNGIAKTKLNFAAKASPANSPALSQEFLKIQITEKVMREVGITSNWPCIYVMNKTSGERIAAQDQNPLALRSNILRCLYRRNSIANKVITTKTSKSSGTEVACNILLINIAGRKHKYIANP